MQSYASPISSSETAANSRSSLQNGKIYYNGETIGTKSYVQTKKLRAYFEKIPTNACSLFKL